MKELDVPQAELAALKASCPSVSKALHGEISIAFASALRFDKALQLDFFPQLVQPSTGARYVFPHPSYQLFSCNGGRPHRNPYVDIKKVGNLNHNKEVEQSADWPHFRNDVIKFLDAVSAKYYITVGLRMVS